MDIYNKVLLVCRGGGSLLFFTDVAAVEEDFLKIGFNDGLNVKGLIIRPEFINRILQENQIDVQVDHGHIESMKLVWTALPGIITLQVKELDIRLRPNLTGIASKEITKKINEMREAVTGEQDETDQQEPSFYVTPPYPYFLSDHPVHDTTATKALHSRIPPPPRIMRHAQFVQTSGMPRPPSRRFPSPVFLNNAPPSAGGVSSSTAASQPAACPPAIPCPTIQHPHLSSYLPPPSFIYSPPANYSPPLSNVPSFSYTGGGGGGGGGGSFSPYAPPMAVVPPVGGNPLSFAPTRPLSPFLLTGGGSRGGGTTTSIYPGTFTTSSPIEM